MTSPPAPIPMPRSCCWPSRAEIEKALAGIRKGIDVLDDRRAQLRGLEAEAGGASDGHGHQHDDDGTAMELDEEPGSRSSPVR